jgi:hypothetical protein
MSRVKMRLDEQIKLSESDVAATYRTIREGVTRVMRLSFESPAWREWFRTAIDVRLNQEEDEEGEAAEEEEEQDQEEEPGEVEDEIDEVDEEEEEDVDEEASARASSDAADDDDDEEESEGQDEDEEQEAGPKLSVPASRPAGPQRRLELDIEEEDLT